MGICKLTIKTYSDDGFSTEKGEYVATINPSNLRITNDIDYNDSPLPFNNSWKLKYNSSLPRQLSFSLLFDNTGVFQNSNIDVRKQIEDLEGLIYNYKKDIKQPYYIRVIWGNIDFHGRLLKMQTEYGIFKNDGNIIRAQTNIVVIEQKPNTNNGASQKELKSNDKKDSSSGKQQASANKDKRGQNKKAENKVQQNKEASKSEETQKKAAKEKEKTQENKEEKNNDKQKEQEKQHDEEHNSQEETNDEQREDDKNNDSKEESSERETKKNETKEAKKNESIITEKTETIVKCGETLPGVMKKCLESSGIKAPSSMLNNLLSKAASFNLLNSLKALVLGSVFVMPKVIAELFKSLLTELLNLLKRGATFIKNGGKALLKKIKAGAKSVANAAKNTVNKAKNEASNFAGKVKSGANNIAGKVKSGAQKVRDKV